MALKTSTGLRKGLLDSASLKDQLDGGLILIYGCVGDVNSKIPATADAAISLGVDHILLCEISLNSTGDGISFAATASGATLSKNGSEVWSGVNVASGVASFYRHVAAGDTGALSTSEPRIQGLIGLAGAELNLSSVNLSSGATQTIDYYSVTLPTL